jgi:DNA-binding FadR family transcriptional regulator
MEIRMVLDPLAVKLAIERGKKKEFSKIEDIFHNFEKALHENDVVNLVISDEAFHDAIAKATHNKLLILMNEKIADAFAEYRTKSFAAEEIAGNALEPHRSILEAIKRGDAEAGKKHAMDHIRISLEDIAKVISAHDKV